MAKAKKVATKSTAKTKKASSPVKKASTTAKPKAKSTATTKSAPKKSAKATSTKKAVAKKVATKAKVAVAKKSAPAKKSATPKKATPVKKVTSNKKAVTSKAKAIVSKKTAPVKKTTAAKPASKKTTAKATPKKAVPAKKAIAVKSAPSKKAESVKKVTPSKKVEAKKATTVAKKEAKVVAKPTAKKIKPEVAKGSKKDVKVAAKAKKSKDTLGVIPPSAEIEDRISRKSTVKQSKDGAVAIIDLNRTTKKTKVKEDLNEEKFETKIGGSILDPVENVGPAYRYSDEDLQEFKTIILKRLETARENLNYYQALMSRKDESGTDDTDNRFNSMEDGSGVMEREQLSQLAARQMQFIDHLEKALMRIENKTYGVCRVTGKLIDKARLRAVPHATLSMEAKSNRR